jgi:hypothetical protein
MKTTKKVRFLFLLFLIVLGTANLKAQVTIGSEQKPREGAVLDLSQVNDQNLGFLLPRVSLENLTDWQLQGDSANGVGMMVYNTNPHTIGGNGIGVYIRTEAKVWETLKSNLPETCSGAPGMPGAISFWGTWGTEVNLGGTFMASIPDDSGPNRPLFYEWGLPKGLTNSSPPGYARSRTITITGKIAGRYEVGSITVIGINACDTSVARINSSAVTVLAD